MFKDQAALSSALLVVSAEPRYQFALYQAFIRLCAVESPETARDFLLRFQGIVRMWCTCTPLADLTEVERLFPDWALALAPDAWHEEVQSLLTANFRTVH